VLNKYIPADFDPKLVPRGKKPKDNLVTVRMMLPFTIQCANCSSFLYRGRKFNSKKEDVKGINGKYLGIQRFRFYIKCTDCARPITFLTDPKNADYEMESGGTRNYEVWHDEKKTNEQFDLDKEEEEKMDSMKSLENRVLESQREMAELDALEEIRAMNLRHVSLMKGGRTMDAAVRVLKAREAALGVDEEELDDNGMTKDEEDLVQSIKFGAAAKADFESIRRLDEDDEKKFEEQRKLEAEALMAKKRSDEKMSRVMPVIKVKRKKKRNDTEDPPAKKGKVAEPSVEKPPDSADEGSSDGAGALGGLMCYGSESD